MPDFSYRAHVLSLNPALYWPLDATYGATDQSGNGRNGTGAAGVAIGAYSGSPIVGETTSTDFDIDLINSTYNPFAAGSTRTFAGWAYRDTTASWHPFFGGDSTNDPFFGAWAGAQHILWAPNDAGTWTYWADAWPGNGVWAHWALVYNDATDSASLYINGRLVSAETMATPYATPGNFTAGYMGAGHPLDGKLAHIAIWERALGSIEVAGLWDAGKTRAPRRLRVVS